MLKVCFWIFGLFLAQPSFAAWRAEDFGFEPGNKLEAIAIASVSWVPGGESTYSYQVYNQPKSRQAIAMFGIEVFSEIPADKKISPKWFSINGLMIDDVRNNSTGKKVATWVFGEHGEKVLPGSSLGSFQIVVKSIPGVKSFYAQGFTEKMIPTVDANEIEPGSEKYKAMTELWNFFNNSYSGLTVGPDAVPETTDAASLVDRLMSLNRQAVKLGWVSKTFSVNEIEKHLKKSKDALASKDEAVSRTSLEQLNVALEAEKAKNSKNLTENGYALLKPNIDFILSKMSGQDAK